jgi:hypothetical protein
MVREKRMKAPAPRGKRVIKQPELPIWKMMIQRSCNPRYADTKHFGVPVCKRWLGTDGFTNFLADLGPQPFPGAGLIRASDSSSATSNGPTRARST